MLDNQGVKLAGRAVKVAGKYFRVEIDVKAKDVLAKSIADLFAFDDLERCEISVNKVLGYINEFVEHDDCKVIIVANEKEIKGGDDYGRIREKLIGKTLEIKLAFEEALAAFTALISDNHAKDFLAVKSDEIVSIYHQAGLNNLRILQQTKWDFERFYAAVADKHRQNDQAMIALLRILFALSFELKAARLRADDPLTKRQFAMVASAMRSRREAGTASPLAIARQRYPNADLDDSTLSDETLVDLLVKGIVDAEKIRSELDLSSYFVTVAEKPAWRTIWHAFERTDEEFEAAFAEMERKFAAREFVVTGEIQHVFGLRLWLSDVGILARTRAKGVEEGKRYVDDLYAAGRLEPTSRHEGYSEMSTSSHGGLGIYERGTAEYRELYEYLREKRRAEEVDRHPALASELLAQMEADPNLFFRRLNLTNSGESVLRHPDPGGARPRRVRLVAPRPTSGKAADHSDGPSGPL